MELYGIIRRIDDLGRIVIPREIRRTLHIRNGDPLEIRATRDGEIILRQYSPVDDVRKVAESLCAAAANSCGAAIVVTSCRAVIAAAQSERDLIDKFISPQLEQIMNERRVYQCGGAGPSIFATEDGHGPVTAAAPIISQDNVLGLVLAVRDGEGQASTETESRLTQTIAAFLGEQAE